MRKRGCGLEIKKPNLFGVGLFWCWVLTMTYFHAVIPRTIIGAAAFHGPVREGKEWFHRAMVVRNSVVLS